MGRGTATTLSSPGYTAGGTSINVASTTNWPSDTGVIFAMDEIELVNGEWVRVDGTFNSYQGTVASATQIDNVDHLSGDGDRNYSAGATTRVYILVDKDRENRLIDGLLVSHDQDGTLKADSVDVTAVIKDAIITNAKLVNDTITEAKTNTKPSEFLSDFIASGGAVAQSAGLVGTFSNIVYYIGGVRYTATSVANKTYTASKDTYVDIGTDGVVDYNEVANNAASPALEANHIRVAIVTTSGAAITNVNQGETTQVIPIASGVKYSVTDSIGNLIYPRTPTPTLIGYRQVTANQAGVTTEVDATGLSVTVIVPEGRKIRISSNPLFDVSNADTYTHATIKEGATYLGGKSNMTGTGAIGYRTIPLEVFLSPTAGSHTYKLAFQRAAGTGTTTLAAGSAAANAQGPVHISVTLV